MDQLSEKERQIAEYTAELVVQKAMDTLVNEEFVDKLFSLWGRKIDVTIGRGLRRLGFYVLLIALGVVVMRFNLTEKVLSFLGMKP